MVTKSFYLKRFDTFNRSLYLRRPCFLSLVFEGIPLESRGLTTRVGLSSRSLRVVNKFLPETLKSQTCTHSPFKSIKKFA